MNSRQFRCLSCGCVREHDGSDGFYYPSSCNRCSESNFVLCGSMSEFYNYKMKDTTCEFGDHIVESTIRFKQAFTDRFSIIMKACSACESEFLVNEQWIPCAKDDF